MREKVFEGAIGLGMLVFMLGMADCSSPASPLLLLSSPMAVAVSSSSSSAMAAASSSFILLPSSLRELIAAYSTRICDIHRL